MTVATTLNRISYTGTGALTVFAYNFRIFASTDLQVYVDSVLKTLTTDYTVSGVNAPTGGNVTFVAAPANNSAILFVRVLAETQPSALPSTGKFPTITVEDALDRLTMEAQQLSEVDARCMKVALTSLFANLVFPDPVAGKFLRWNAGLTGVENADIGAGGAIGLPVSVAQGGTGSITAAAALTALGGAKLLTPQVLTPGASPAIDASLGDTFTLVPNQNFTIPNPTNPTNGQRIIIRIKQDGAGSRLLTGFGAKWVGGVDITLASIVLSTTAAKVDYIGAYYNSTDDTWAVLAFVKGY